MTTKHTYHEALEQALSQPAAVDCRMTNEQISAAIGNISEQLQGRPLPNSERLLLVADRAELRATLKARGQQ